MPSKYLKTDDQGITRCWWCGDDRQYRRYHDEEWGRPVDCDRKLFEKICLEGFQSGLSWLTILKRREAFRVAFANFHYSEVARFNKRRVEKLVEDASIIRHRGKIEATVNNASRALEIQQQFGSLAGFFWQFEPSRPYRFDAKRSECKESRAMSKQLKRRGWRFVGPTTCYALMQAMGLVNDHHTGCHAWSRIDELRRRFARPGSS